MTDTYKIVERLKRRISIREGLSSHTLNEEVIALDCLEDRETISTIEALAEALKPFAAIIDAYEDTPNQMDGLAVYGHVPMADLRRARSALNLLKGEGVTAQPRAEFDLVKHLHRQRAFSERTFGPGARTAGVIDHIRKELREIEDSPADIMEWIDVVLLALDGAWRAGWTPEQIASAIAWKQTRNEGRTWPDWRTADPNKGIEHDRSADSPISDKGETG